MSQKPKSTFGHPDCYAKELGGCSHQISGEHYVSQAILRLVSKGEPSVLVRNLTFQKQASLEPKGIGKLVAKVLCDTHNRILSPYDDSGRALFSGMDQIDSGVGKIEETPATIIVNGDGLERWMLKTICGGLFSGNIPVSGGSMKGVGPPKEWLDILFADGKFSAGQGLYVRAGTPGVTFATDPSVLKIEVISDPDDVVIGLSVWIFNFEFILVLASLPPQLPEMLEYSQYRPKGIVVQGSSKRIQIAWHDGIAGDELVVKWLGRG